LPRPLDDVVLVHVAGAVLFEAHDVVGAAVTSSGVEEARRSVTAQTCRGWWWGRRGSSGGVAWCPGARARACLPRTRWPRRCSARLCPAPPAREKPRQG
jgi:hypothetical protein